MWLAFAGQAGYRQLTVYFRLGAFVRYYRTVQLGSMWRAPMRLRQSLARSGGAAYRRR